MRVSIGGNDALVRRRWPLQDTEVPGWGRVISRMPVGLAPALRSRPTHDRHPQAPPPPGKHQPLRAYTRPSGTVTDAVIPRDGPLRRRDQTSLTATSPAPLVSIITPTYNHAAYIGRCLESVLAQTDPRWEQIVVDDGSTDRTAEIVSRFTDPRIRYVAQRHRGIAGLGAAYNLALGMARGDYVAILEGDDFWPQDKLERQLPAFQNAEVVLSWGLAAETDPAGEIRRLTPKVGQLRRHQHKTAAQTIQLLLEENCIPACTVVCRTSALRAVGGFHQPEGIPNVDYPTWLQLCRVGRFAPVDRIVGFYRRHDDQVSMTMTNEMLRNLDLGPAFVEALDVRERKALHVSVDAARRLARQGRAEVAFAAGRVALREGRRRVAKAYFRRALREGESAFRLRAMVGLAAVYLGTDLDAISAMYRNLRIRQEARELAAVEFADASEALDLRADH
jgi:glycosyltransferase involved in cell wall biosynthesis